MLIEEAALSKASSVPLKAEGGVEVKKTSLETSPSIAPSAKGTADKAARSKTGTIKIASSKKAAPRPVVPTEASGTAQVQKSSDTAALQTSVPIPKTSNPKPVKKTHPKGTAWKTSWMFKCTTGPPVATIEYSSLLPDPTPVTSTSSFTTLCSYNWQTTGSIFVPGRPPKWTPPPLPATLPADTGRHFVDQNAYHVPKYPFEPAFQALSIMNPNISLSAVDIITNRNSLRKLLDFSAGKRLDPFAMGLDMINETLVLSRMEVSARQMVRGGPNSGYGHNFEKAFTTAYEGMDGSSSHHRVIRYHIGPLDCVVRFEVDAYFDDGAWEREDNTTEDPTNAITTAITKLNLANPYPSTKHTTKVIQKGTPVPSSLLAEIKAKRAGRLTEALPQLWFGRTPYFMNGNHVKGVVSSVTMVHAATEFAQWEALHQERLCKMVGLLGWLKEVVRGIKRGEAVLVYDEKGGALKVYARKEGAGGGGGVLPKGWVAAFWR
ncbi:geranylgeranyl pyrophosphate synthetase [Pyrenophora seminiperda CCB06]|uniref:Geranylgeranyl pyrophosphate synthetase n=1 Tax=Pyrenophora seminiperda CCB06 TaxID=1302712 RepID=A0A3M7MG37_9PLEO|nr:geranylgeranyl pyrophosphate synthetase [Pyrenophora seminiperda CCB06]